MGSSQLCQAFIVLLLLCVIPSLAESAIPFHQQPLSVIGYTGIDTGPSTSRPGGGGRTPSP
ncbi:BnaA06g02200D [Brassica napus]|uniref:BnaA06g02200D protein n=1 Tax=Brassica napus TaxID=3708 RepID=A0A078GCT3_BRANA|nr:BnaA06g02200D [Brassica napus]